MTAPKPIFSNFFENLPARAGQTEEEVFEAIAKNDKLEIERIVSDGHTSREWYDQDETEFCCVLRGAADLLFEGESSPVRMEPGAWVIIPAHARHKVTWTHSEMQTIWIAVKWRDS